MNLGFSKMSIFEERASFGFNEQALDVDLQAFKNIVYSRRSVRIYEPVPIPEAVVYECLDMALKAPNSSNLQPWEFYWVRTAQKKRDIIEACLSQPAAATASELIVCVARIKTWKRNRDLLVHELQKLKEQGTNVPNSVFNYYLKVVPLAYTQGIFGFFGFCKKILISIIGLRRIIPREPTSVSQLKTWAIKSTALACENLMLAFRAYGFDSCPMEGYDSVRVKKVLNLPSDSEIVMIISAGKRNPERMYGPQIRLDKNLFIKEV